MYTNSTQLTQTNRGTHRQTFSHPPAPALVAGADVVAAPPSAAAVEASVAGAGVAKASEVRTNPSREQRDRDRGRNKDEK